MHAKYLQKYTFTAMMEYSGLLHEDLKVEGKTFLKSDSDPNLLVHDFIQMYVDTCFLSTNFCQKSFSHISVWSIRNTVSPFVMGSKGNLA